MESNHRCEFCNTDVHRTSFVKHLKSKKPSEIETQGEMIISEWFFKEPVENQNKEMYKTKPFKQKVRKNF